MSPFVKGALGFIGCAGLFGAAYAIGKKVGREETLKEVEQEEQKIAEAPVQQTIIKELPVQQSPSIMPVAETESEPAEIIPVVTETAVERVRNKRQGIKGKLFGGVNLVKDLLGGNADGKKLIVTMEDGDVVARLSQKGA